MYRGYLTGPMQCEEENKKLPEKYFQLIDIFLQKYELDPFLPIFGGILGRKIVFFRFQPKFDPNRPKKGPKIKKSQKSKKQVLFVFQKANCVQKIMANGSLCDEFYCLEGNFGPFFVTMGFPIHFAFFRRTSQL